MLYAPRFFMLAQGRSTDASFDRGASFTKKFV
jgi:hypothetical protein